MQDYDHWDALVIGEWPPGRSGPPGVCHTPSLFYLSSLLWYFFVSLFCLFLFACHVCRCFVMSSIFHSGDAIISSCVDKLHVIGSGPAVGFFSSTVQ